MCSISNALLNAFAENNVSMADLSLKGLALDPINAESISKMVSLRTLRLLRTRGSNKRVFMNMVQKMQHLEYVFCGGSIKFSSNDIVEMIGFLSKLSKLHLTNQKDIVIGLDHLKKMNENGKKSKDEPRDVTLIIWGDGLNVIPPKKLLDKSGKGDDSNLKGGNSLQFKFLNNVEDDSIEGGEDVIRMSDCTFRFTPGN